jgi:hypothetical protein
MRQFLVYAKTDRPADNGPGLRQRSAIRLSRRPPRPRPRHRHRDLILDFIDERRCQAVSTVAHSSP